MTEPAQPQLSIARASFYNTPKGGTEQKPWPDAVDRRAVPGDAVLRCPPDDLAPAQRRASREREADTLADAPDGIDANRPEAQCQQASEGAQDLSLPAERAARVERPNQVLMLGYNLPADATRVPVSRRHHGLAHLEHAGGKVLR